jgi:CRP/FNR family transcriptional regulator, cyclic AMP receptor protein
MKVRRFPRRGNSRRSIFCVESFLDPAGLGREVAKFRGRAIIFAQGDPATSVLYIQNGRVKLSVVNKVGKAAVVSILGPDDVVGEECLAGKDVRMRTATAIGSTTVLTIEKNEMIRMLHQERRISDQFVAHVLARNARAQEALIDHLLNSTEKRLARTLLLLARFGEQDRPQKVAFKISQQTLAEMVGTTRSRINFFMNKFRKLGFIQFRGEIHVNSSLLSVVLHDKRSEQNLPPYAT